MAIAIALLLVAVGSVAFHFLSLTPNPVLAGAFLHAPFFNEFIYNRVRKILRPIDDLRRRPAPA